MPESNQWNLSHQQIDLLVSVVKHGHHPLDTGLAFLETELELLEPLIDTGLVAFGAYGEVYIIDREIKTWIEEQAE